MSEYDDLIHDLSEELGQQLGGVLSGLSAGSLTRQSVQVEVCSSDYTLLHITIGSGDRDDLILTATCPHCGFESWEPVDGQKEDDQETNG